MIQRRVPANEFYRYVKDAPKRLMDWNASDEGTAFAVECTSSFRLNHEDFCVLLMETCVGLRQVSEFEDEARHGLELSPEDAHRLTRVVQQRIFRRFARELRKVGAL